ncbi:IDEAL domain-containing protein [Bacillus sp. N9]
MQKRREEQLRTDIDKALDEKDKKLSSNFQMS